MPPVRVIWSAERTAHLVPPPGEVLACYRAILAAGIAPAAEIVPGSRTVQVRVRDDAPDPDRVIRDACAAAERSPDVAPHRLTRTLQIPVCYDPDLGPDLAELAERAGLSPAAAAALHASGNYAVRFLGFSPGFPYIDGLPGPLHAPRIDSPRPRIRPGSVGIAGSRTGIYPQATPGGWRLIGATPLRLFDPTRDQPALLAPGDRVRFRRIDRAEFDRREREQT